MVYIIFEETIQQCSNNVSLLNNLQQCDFQINSEKQTLQKQHITMNSLYFDLILHIYINK